MMDILTHNKKQRLNSPAASVKPGAGFSGATTKPHKGTKTMQTITHNKKTINISAAQARIINTIARECVVAISELAEGSGKRTRYSTDLSRVPGIQITWTDTVKNHPSSFTKKVRDFVAKNPRVRQVVYDLNGICKKYACKLNA